MEVSSQAQSALDPAGRGAEEIATLFYWMASLGGLIWLVVIGLAIYAMFLPGEHHPKLTRLFVIGGGALLPTVALTTLLCYSLPMLPRLHQPLGSPVMEVEVAGVRWWWRVRYHREESEAVESANEIRIPVGKEIELKLRSEDVIHSFWVPSLTGKVDMIPGRVTRLKLEPTREGVYRGLCAEYCGESHTWMNFVVIVMSQEDFEQWWDEERADAREIDESQVSADSTVLHGASIFTNRGCGACHTVRGTSADGTVGPDLTHFGSRLTVGAGLLAAKPQTIAQWVHATEELKPGVTMPSFQSLSDDELTALATYLEWLE